jgi:hypothetical protein
MFVINFIRTGKEIVTQIIPIPESVLNIPGRFSDATVELLFEAANISPLSYQSYYVMKKTNESCTLENNTTQTDKETTEVKRFL